MTEESQLAYAAGLLDGESCIGAYNIRQATETKSPYAQVTVVVGMVTPFAVKFLHEMFGGTLIIKKPKDTRRLVFCWTVRNLQAEECLRRVLPFLREKREQAEVALALSELRRSRKGTQRLTSEEITERETYVQKLKDLKRVEYSSISLQ